MTCLQGRYIPLFASAVYDQNAVLVSKGLTPINLTSAIIGMYSETRTVGFADSSSPQATELRILSRWSMHTIL